MTIISKNIRQRCPEHLVVGEGSIVDDFCYFSTQVRIGKYSHIANNCSIAGGEEFQFALGDFSSLSSGCRIWCCSDDYVNDIISCCVGSVRDHLIKGDVILGNFTGVGSNTVIMPGNNIPEGVAVGALSFVPPFYNRWEPWSIYAGVGKQFRKIGERNKQSVSNQFNAFRAVPLLDREPVF